MKRLGLRCMTLICGICFWAVGSLATASSFVAIKDSECLNGAFFTGYTYGQQYVDSGNGVLNNTYSMLGRWQGSDLLVNSVSYDMGHLTGFHTPYQRGRVPQDPNGSPGAQQNCQDEGVLINTWDTPHRPIVGGGYNDQWGYAWSSTTQVNPFVDGAGTATELVLQANLGFATYLPWPNIPGHMNSDLFGNVVLFAYVEDTTHPNLHPIAILAQAHASDAQPGSKYYLKGTVAWDYSDNDTATAVQYFSPWFAPGQTGNGVWFSSGPISTDQSNTNPYIKTRYTVGNDDTPLAIGNNSNPTMLFFRAHITQANLIQAITDITNNACTGPPRCPAKGYSTNPAYYKLLYAGVATEVAIKTDGYMTGHYDASPTNWIRNDVNKDQVSLGLHINGFSVWRYYP